MWFVWCLVHLAQWMARNIYYWTMYILCLTAYVTDCTFYTTVQGNVHMQFTRANQSPLLHLFYLQILYYGHSYNHMQHITYGREGIKLFSITEEEWHVSWAYIRLNQPNCLTKAMFGYVALNESNWKSINSNP